MSTLARARFLALVVLAGAAAAAAHARIPVIPPGEQAPQFVPRPEVARATALGFEALLADAFWLQAVQVIGAERGNPRRHAELLGRLVDVVTTLDPWVDHPYRFAAIWLTDTPARVRFANRLIERGIAYHPRDWRNHFYLGFNHFFYLGDNAAAASALEAAVGLPGAPAYISRLVARLRANAGDLETAAAFLAELHRSSEDEHLRQGYLDALLEVETERRARHLDAARAEYRRRRGADIQAVQDLVRGPGAPLAALPPELNGASWTLDAESGRIVSTHYGRRYELHVHAADRAQREAWRRAHGREAP